jgi:hypothetical protein
MPPVPGVSLEDIGIPAGQITHLVLDADIFIDPDEGDALKYMAFATHANRLPGRVKFDSHKRQFEFQPPPASRGDLAIRVVAKDFDGLEAHMSFTVSYGV